MSRRRWTPRRWGFWITLAALILKPPLLLFTRPRWGGLEHVPARGGVILAANHVSLADPMTLADFCLFGAGRIPAFLGKAPVFSVFFVGRVLRGARQIPVYRERADGGGALDAAVTALGSGACVVIYPEGTVTRDPQLWPMAGRTGVARLALATGAPVVPVGQWGPQRLRGPEARPRLRTPVATLAGPPVDLSPYYGVPMTPAVLRAATAQVMTAISALVGELRGEQPPAESAGAERLAG